VATLRARDHGETALRRRHTRGDHLANAGRVDGHGLLHEDVLARRDRRLEVGRAEVRRRGEDHVVDVLLAEEALVRVEPDVASIVGHRSPRTALGEPVS
jgi:hypothetical protein